MIRLSEHASSSTLVIDSFVSEGAVGPIYFENTGDLSAGMNGERGCRVLILQRAERAVGRPSYGREGHWDGSEAGRVHTPGVAPGPRDLILNRVAQSLGV